jgi:hypothetical protein
MDDNPYNELLRTSSGSQPTSPRWYNNYLKNKVPSCPCKTHTSSDCASLAFNTKEHKTLHKHQRKKPTASQQLPECCILALYAHVLNERVLVVQKESKLNRSSSLKKVSSAS